MPRISDRLERLEHGLNVGDDGGPSMILLTALGRDDEEIVAIRLGNGSTLNRLTGEPASDFKSRAATWATAADGQPVKLAAAIYRNDVPTEVSP